MKLLRQALLQQWSGWWRAPSSGNKQGQNKNFHLSAGQQCSIRGAAMVQEAVHQSDSQSWRLYADPLDRPGKQLPGQSLLHALAHHRSRSSSPNPGSKFQVTQQWQSMMFAAMATLLEQTPALFCRRPGSTHMQSQSMLSDLTSQTLQSRHRRRCMACMQTCRGSMRPTSGLWPLRARPPNPSDSKRLGGLLN